MNMRSRLGMVALAAATLLFLVACSRVFYVKPAGRLGEAITFPFYEEVADGKPTDHTITQFAVQERTGTNWTLVWGLTGNRSLSAITYGAKYEGFTEAMPAKPLSRGSKYRVVTSDLPRFKPAGAAVAYFVFDESGALVVSDPK
jgi:hypothetical protein